MKEGYYEVKKMPVPKNDWLINCDIHVWRFHEAPGVFQMLSNNGGDEDWLCYCKKKFYEDNYVPFFQEGMNGSIGACDISVYDLDEYLVIIGSHS